MITETQEGSPSCERPARAFTDLRGRHPLRRRRRVKSSCVQRYSGELSAGAMPSSHYATRVADTRAADQAAEDDESTRDPYPQAEGIERRGV